MENLYIAANRFFVQCAIRYGEKSRVWEKEKILKELKPTSKVHEPAWQAFSVFKLNLYASRKFITPSGLDSLTYSDAASMWAEKHFRKLQMQLIPFFQICMETITEWKFCDCRCNRIRTIEKNVEWNQRNILYFDIIRQRGFDSSKRGIKISRNNCALYISKTKNFPMEKLGR